MTLPVQHEALQEIGAAQNANLRGESRRPRHDCRRRCRCGGRRPETVGAEPDFAASSYRPKVMSTASRQFCAGWTLISITPGSGVTLITSTRGS